MNQEEVRQIYLQVRDYVLEHWQGLLIGILALSLVISIGKTAGLSSRNIALEATIQGQVENVQALNEQIAGLHTSLSATQTALNQAMADLSVESQLLQQATAQIPSPVTATPEPVATIAPASSVDHELFIRGIISGTYEIEYVRTVQAGEKIVGSIVWDDPFANWRIKMKHQGSVNSKAWNCGGQSYSFEYVATQAGTYSLRIINEKTNHNNTGTMTISGSWAQTED